MANTFRSRFTALIVATFVCANASMARGGTIIFDSYNVPATGSTSTAGTPTYLLGFATTVSVANNTDISGLQIHTYLAAPENEIFQIYDITTQSRPGFGGVLVYDSGLIAAPQDVNDFTPDCGTWKSSPTFAFTLLGGHQYAIGFEADGSFLTSTNKVLNSENEITATGDYIILNGYAQSFDTVATSIRIESQQGSTVPEPSTFALLAIGGIGLAVRAYRRSKVSSSTPS